MIRALSRVYVNQILSTLPKSQLHLSTPVRSVWSSKRSQLSKESSHELEVRLVTVVNGIQQVEAYDHVILACHSDTALEVLRAGNISVTEERILESFRWNKNEAALHADEGVGKHINIDTYQ